MSINIVISNPKDLFFNKKVWPIFLFAFLLIVGASTFVGRVLGLPVHEIGYWDRHGLFFLIFITIFPRLTLLLSSIPFGGLFWWLGWFFAPRVLVAILATYNYWDTNEVLVFFSWLVAFTGESSEKYYINKNRPGGRNEYRQTNTFEAEYTVKKDEEM